MTPTVIIGTNALVSAAWSLYKQGIISKGQLIDIEIRNNILVPDEWKEDAVWLTE